MFPKEALAIRSFRNLWLGQAISQLGDAFYYVVFMFMVGKITGSDAMVGFAGAAETLPFFFFAGYAGVLADRLDRKRIMMLSDLLSGTVLSLFGVFVYLNVSPPGWTLLAVAGTLSCLRAFFLPAKTAAIPAIVPEELLMKANSLSTMTESFMPMIGLALSASLLGLLYSISRQWFFPAFVWVNAASFFGSAAYIRLLPEIRAKRVVRLLDGGDSVQEERHVWREFRAGVGYIRRHPVLRVYIWLTTGLNLMMSPFFVAYVACNREWFGGTPQMLCFLEFTFFVGLVVASSVAGKVKHRRVGSNWIICTSGLGLAIAGMGLSKSVWGFSALNAVCGLVLPFSVIPLTTYLQLSVPDHFRGRVNSVISMMRCGALPLGMSLGGVLLAHAGLVGMFYVMGFGLVGVAVAACLSRSFRTAVIPGGAVEAHPVPPAEPVPVMQAS